MPSAQRRPMPRRSVPPSGLREQNKIDKLRRIGEAARALFIEKGFDDATTREIALRAGVGIGTVFTYAENKRDLLFLIANDDLDEVSRNAEAGLRDDASCLDNLLGFFRLHYRFFARQPELSRLLLREMTFYDSGRQASRFLQTRERNIRVLGRIVEMAAEQGALRLAEKPDFVGWVAFCVFQVELRRWLMGKTLNLADGMARLERALRVCMAGWGAKPEALARR